MHTRSPILVVLVALAVLAGGAPQAGAAACGSIDRKTGARVKGTLEFDQKASDIDKEFKKRLLGAGRKKEFVLSYAVSGCELTVAPTVTSDPLKDVEDLPPGVPGISPQQVQPLRTELRVAFMLGADEFDPGAYGKLIVIRDPTRIATTRTTISVSQSASGLWAAGIGLLAGVIGFGFFYISKRMRRFLLILGRKWVLIAGGVAGLAGLYAAMVDWSDQDIWTFGDNWKATAATAFTQSTAGALALMLSGVFSEKAQPEPKPD